MKTRIICLCAALALTGCVTANGAGIGGFKRFVKHDITPAERQPVIGDVTPRLKDPDSAKFGSMSAGVTSKGFITICGEVNARNSFNGYTGMQPYVVTLTADGKQVHGDTLIYGGDRVQNMMVQSICGNVHDAI